VDLVKKWLDGNHKTQNYFENLLRKQMMNNFGEMAESFVIN